MLKSFLAGRRRGSHGSFRVQSGRRVGLLAAAIASAAILHSSTAAALGLGDITLHSALGQPFNADIELIEAGGLTPEEILVTLASAEAFNKAGVERLFFFNDLRFTPVIRGNRAVVRVESHKPVTEPYMDFLVRLSRPNGDQLREYTVLLDPPNSPAGLAATRSRTQSPATATQNDQSRFPVAPPKAVQGKHYTVVSGDTLAGIARQLQAAGSKSSSTDLISGIQALNPQAFPNGERSQLKIGQSLLLPDAAAEPKVAAPASSAAGSPPPAPVSGTAPPNAAEQLTATAMENQTLAKAVDDLKAQVQQISEDKTAKDKQIIELQTQLAEMKALAARPAPTAPAVPANAAPVQRVEPAQPTALPAPVAADDEFPWTTVLAALLLLILLLALAWSVRRNRIRNALEPVPDAAEAIVKPAQTVTPVFEVPAVTPRPLTTASPAAPAAPAGQRLAGAATDALDGASIYIAYGRFAEALAILRDALKTQPQRTDVRMRVLELLGEQGDIAGFNEEENILLGHGVEPEKLAEIRARYPKLKVEAASAPEPEPERSSSLAPAAVVGPAVVAAATAHAAQGANENAPLQLDESAAAALNPEPVDDFQLNLDDLSLDADWDLVDPFDSTPVRKPETAAEPEVDPSFASDLTQLPEVFEMPEEQFLSDYAEEEAAPAFEVEFEPAPETASVAQSASDSLDDEFLDSFLSDDIEFDLMELDSEPLSKLNEAQVLIDEGNIEDARRLLREVIDESDDGLQQSARDLLAGLD
ncbi:MULTISPECIES: FimV/HubP family polar landmark protein [unclassified Pseudomonas]|uniref:FimV/HubP family polar landmark protein n=1 Tax=unclassified Pseudomonas TaxID=196821 RepID=UPI000D3C9BBB|nr:MULTISPECIES: FimV/HubP family polar landmark protein [unclassified Pseudomonas]RAU45879.1 peptigoglycan-binding protein LysM [Pseudomonas sp. RIT 409]RAU56022.1 peptigoglycan-binding protein LysM [Pseudomonas sp. RIT 412]